ncbi:MAG: helicase-associated domain-containing protein [Microbacteriaceae bacterium]|nr:helicase-associated domain-containing protein [Microbacteriaceae bacterium]
MPDANGTVLAFAARLRGLDDEALTRLVTARGVRDHGIHDFFDLAEALLDRASVQHALERLDRGTLAMLATAGELAAVTGAPSAAELARRLGVDAAELGRRTTLAVEAGLLAEDSGRYVPWDAVTEQLRAWPSSGLPTAPELASAPPPAALEPVSSSDARFVDRGAGDRAFATLVAVTELLYALRAEPARRLARGGTALPDARRLATAASVEPEDVDLLLDIASRAGLADAGADWTANPAAETWLTASRLERWAVLAGGWRDRLPEELHDLLRQRAHAVWGGGLLDYLGWLYPAGGTWIRERAEQAAREAELLGITGSSTPSTPGAALLLDGPEAATTAMAELLPAEVDKVYLQPDLSVIAPGPLEARLDARLRVFADAEPGGLASSYRVTAQSVTRALTAGESAEGIREVLSVISLTGIPQPLQYLLDDTSARFGALRVGSLDPGAGAPDSPDAGASSYVRSDDPALLDRVVVDQSLAVLVLRRTGAHRAVTRFDAGVLYWALADARYPVVAEDASGAVVVMRRERRSGAPAVVGDDTAAILVQRVRAGAAEEPEETGQAWLARQLELAIRNKLTVNVVVRMPDGSETGYPLEPAALAGGRLRARDRRSDIERTLPLSHIVAVTPLG